ncbi:MAG: hypothetical protein LBD13_00260, partial [Spirochaetaceae bacterium]|nr:hypothetical protein [Spirochaetaceae bacterium]
VFAPGSDKKRRRRRILSTEYDALPPDNALWYNELSALSRLFKRIWGNQFPQTPNQCDVCSATNVIEAR